MAKITIAGDALVVTSTKTLEDIKTLEKYRPSALELRDEEGNVTYRVGSTTSRGSINAYGASFSGVAENTGNATITLAIPSNVTDKKEYAAETVGASIINLGKVEAQVDSAITEVNTEKATVRSSIVVA